MDGYNFDTEYQKTIKFKACSLVCIDDIQPFHYVGNIFSSDFVLNGEDYSGVRLTVDTIEDFLVIQKVIVLLGTDKPWLDYVNALQSHLEIKTINNHLTRNEGYEKSISSDKIA